MSLDETSARLLREKMTTLVDVSRSQTGEKANQLFAEAAMGIVSAEAEQEKLGGGIVAQLIQKNYNDYAATSQALIDSLTAQVAELKAEHEIVRMRLDTLFDNPYMPQPSTILRQFIVTRAEIKAWIEGAKFAD